ncbi:matrix metalloproteinase-24-like [Pecten maximus]|uniref:matrix metalloproteinase-24-like n=1 Tax=Pecten maximus TaxID=6579 RepID=UPI001458F0DD|nr:matrix metalloproteinase-24-like [Pecten maximus]
MAEPRCGIPDDVHPEVKKRKKRQASKTLKIAFQTWSRVIPKHFKFTIENPDIAIKFARGIHGDGYYNGFDGRGMTLAHAFRPGTVPLAGDTHFDDDEEWCREGRGNATNPDLLAVAIHEFGHAIGLDHSADYDSVMSAFFSTSKTELTYSDIRAAQTIYGSKRVYVPPPQDNSVTRTTSNIPGNNTAQTPRSRHRPTTTTQSPTNNRRRNTTPKPWFRFRPRTTTDSPTPTLKKLSPCQGVDATFLGNDGYVSVIVNDTLFQADRRSGTRKSLALRSIYPNAPIPVGAATYVKGRLYLFKDNYVWRYTKYKLDYGFPKKVLTHENGEYPRAAKTKFWEWSIWHDNVIGRRQYDITQFWKGVPSSPDAAVTWSDQAIYFVKNDMYYKVSQRTRRLSRRFPKHMPAPWMRGICEKK